jgi:hypothetical protein
LKPATHINCRRPLLCARRERPERRGAKERDAFAPFQFLELAEDKGLAGPRQAARCAAGSIDPTSGA